MCFIQSKCTVWGQQLKYSGSIALSEVRIVVCISYEWTLGWLACVYESHLENMRG